MSLPEKQKSHNPYHPDIALFLVLIPFISAFNYYLTYTNIRLNGFLLLRFAIDTAQGYLAWWAVRIIIIYLNKKYPYEKSAVKRIILQQVIILIAGVFIIGSTTELLSWIVKGKAAPLSFYTVDLVIISIWFFAINGIYVGLHYYHLWEGTEALRQQENRSKAGGLMVKHGKHDLMLPFDELEGLYVDDEYVVACHTQGKKYYLDQSLDKVEKILPSALFFRLNRQFVLHRQVISGFRRGENGKIVVLSHNTPCFPSEITVSRTKAPSFKSWFRPGQTHFA
jgi:hypothetical protein